MLFRGRCTKVLAIWCRARPWWHRAAVLGQNLAVQTLVLHDVVGPAYLQRIPCAQTAISEYGSELCCFTQTVNAMFPCRYDGIWHQGTARCGTYTEIQPAPPGAPGSIPNIELFSPEEVLQEAAAAAAGVSMVSAAADAGAAAAAAAWGSSSGGGSGSGWSGQQHTACTVMAAAAGGDGGMGSSYAAAAAETY